MRRVLLGLAAALAMTACNLDQLTPGPHDPQSAPPSFDPSPHS